MTDAARARFWAGLGSTRRLALEAMPDAAGMPAWPARLEAALDEGGAVAGEGQAEGGEAWLSREDFAAELASRLQGEREDADVDVASWWEHLRAGDLYLASACARGVPAALAELERRFGDEMASTARRFERRGLSAEELLQLLRVKLFTVSDGAVAVAGADARPRIAAYGGQGFLQNWLRVTTTRTFIDACRGHTAAEIPFADELEATLREPGADPELGLLQREHRAHFRAAFAETVAALSSSDRLLLRQHLVQRLTIDQIGALHRLHRTTAARRLVRIRAELLEGVREVLGRRLGVSPDRLASIVDLVGSRPEVSLERLLR